jgi:hypothetical protein
MADALSIQQKLNSGYKKVGQKLGQPTKWYRTLNGQNPITQANLLSNNLMIYFATKSTFQSIAPQSPNDTIWFGAMDRSNMLSFDYLTNYDGDTYFISDLSLIKPTPVVRCNEVLNFYRQTSINQTNPNYYAGYSASNNINLIMENIPVSFLSGTKGDRSLVGLPDDQKLPWMKVIAPDLGIEILTDDICITQSTNLRHRYVVSLVERTALGYRLSIAYTGT